MFEPKPIDILITKKINDLRYNKCSVGDVLKLFDALGPFTDSELKLLYEKNTARSKALFIHSIQQHLNCSGAVLAKRLSVSTGRINQLNRKGVRHIRATLGGALY